MSEGGGLQEFVEHVEELNCVDDYSGATGFASEFQRIRELTAEYKARTPRSCGTQQNTVKKNRFATNDSLEKIGFETAIGSRYKDIIPYDEYRVVLPFEEDEDGTVLGSDYINASV